MPMTNIDPWEILRMRRSRGLTLRQAVADAYFNPDTLSRWERGITSPGFSNWYFWLTKLAEWDKAHPAPKGKPYYTWLPIAGVHSAPADWPTRKSDSLK